MAKARKSTAAKLVEWASMTPHNRERDLERTLERRYRPVLTSFMVNGANEPGPDVVPTNFLVQFTAVGVKLPARRAWRWEWSAGPLVLQHSQPGASEGLWEYHFFCKTMTQIVTVLDKELARACHYREVANAKAYR